VRLVGTGTSPSKASRRTPDWLDGLVGDAEALQYPANEAARGKLVLEAWVRLEALLGESGLAVGIDPGCQGLRAIGRQTTLREKFDATNVLNVELCLNPVPKGKPGFPENSGRFGRVWGRFPDDRQR
jgi:hypothetical protein